VALILLEASSINAYFPQFVIANIYENSAYDAFENLFSPFLAVIKKEKKSI